MNRKILLVAVFFFGFLFLFRTSVFARDGGDASLDPDVNIRLRGWTPSIVSPNAIIPHPENTDTKQPQLSSTFSTSPNFLNFFQVHARGGQGYEGSVAGLANIKMDSGQQIKAPITGYEIAPGYNYVVLYMSENDVVIHNTLDDSVASGYTIHFLDIKPNPALKALYDQNERFGRKQLVEISCETVIGTADGNPLVSMRDTGSFMDIRYIDWWNQPSGTCSGLPPTTITPQAPLVKPFDLTQEVPCTSTTDPEFHSLRPYPASPCYKKVKDTTLLCANDLVVVKTPQETTQSNDCKANTDGSFTCTYKDVPFSSDVSISIDSAKLPIMGNTEDVPNGIWTKPDMPLNNLTATQRLNNYVSWYLNGTVNKAEEDFSAYNPDYLVNYSGPINKLMPWDLQLNKRMETIAAAQETPSKSPDDTTARHDQIAGCNLLSGSILAAAMIPCYVSDAFIGQILNNQNDLAGFIGKLLLNLAKFKVRLTTLGQHAPPLPGKYTSFEEFWRDYINWHGKEVCSPLVANKFYFCIGMQNALQVYSLPFPYTPNSTTEDRKGTIGTDTNSYIPIKDSNTGELVAGGPLGNSKQSDPHVSEVLFFPTSTGVNGPDSSKHSLYFAHMQEDAELAKMLQNTFVPTGLPTNEQGYSGKNDDGQGFYDTNKYQHCEIKDAKTNPGDSLHGDINRLDEHKQLEQQISGTLKFKATYNCTFSPGSDGKYSVTCNKVYASMAIFTRTPLAQENWEREVGGNMSVFKKIFPQVGPNSPLTQIKELPAVTNASYQSSSGDKVLAGKFESGTPGSQAQVYIPYVGGIQEYFLNGIQTALRPQGMGSATLAGAPAPGSDALCKINCNINVPDSAIPSSYLSIKENFISLAGRWTDGKGQPHAKECFNDVVRRSLDAGVNPYFSLAIWVHESGASNYTAGTITSCKTQDFGVNVTSIAANFDAQIGKFLALPNEYKSHYPECFTSSYTPMENFMHIYFHGPELNDRGICGPTQQDIDYDNEIQGTWAAITSCNYPSYPTVLSCR